MMLTKSDFEDEPKPAAAAPGQSGIDPFDGPKIPDMGSLDEGENPFGAPAESPPEPPPEPKPAAPATPPAADHFDGPAVPDMSDLGDNPFGDSATEEKKEEPKPEPKPEPEKREERKEEEEKDEPKPDTAPDPEPAPPPAPAPEPVAAKKKAVVVELIGNLTPEIKCELVQVARSHIDDESKWVHGRATGKGPTLAARKLDGDFVAEKFDSKGATHYSIVGSLFLAMEERNVKSTAGGRSEMLHEEIEDAVRKITGKSKEEKADPLDLSYQDSLKVLDTMYAKYIKMAGGDLTAAPKPMAAEGELKELLEREAMKVTASEVLKVLVAEIDELKKRIDELENK